MNDGPKNRYVKWQYNTAQRRFWASVLDGFIFSMVSVVFVPAITWATGASIWLALLLYFLHQCLWFAYSIGCHGLCGQTVGKMVANVKVLAVDQQPLGLARAFKRDAVPLGLMTIGILFEVISYLAGNTEAEVGRASAIGFILVTATPLLWFAAEILTMLGNDKRRALHDYIAGSVVVRTDALAGARKGRLPPKSSGMPAKVVSRPVLIILGILALALIGALTWLQLAPPGTP